MDILSIIRLLRRRIILVAPLAVLCAVSLVGIYKTSPATYRVSSSFVLLSPAQKDPTSTNSTSPTVPQTTSTKTTSPDRSAPVTAPKRTATPSASGNPYLRFGDLSVVVDIVARVLRSAPAGARLRTAGAIGTWTVGANITFYNGPIIDVVVEAPSQAAAIHTAGLVVKEAQHDLDRLQTGAGADPGSFIKTATIVPPDRATTVLSGTLRRLIAAAGAEMLALLGIAVLADLFANRRAARRAARRGDPGPPSRGRREASGRRSDTAEPEPVLAGAVGVVSSSGDQFDWEEREAGWPGDGRAPMERLETTGRSTRKSRKDARQAGERVDNGRGGASKELAAQLRR